MVFLYGAYFAIGIFLNKKANATRVAKALWIKQDAQKEMELEGSLSGVELSKISWDLKSIDSTVPTA
jgi:hypothetical protein